MVNMPSPWMATSSGRPVDTNPPGVEFAATPSMVEYRMLVDGFCPLLVLFVARPRYSRNTALSPRNAGVEALATLFAATSSASSWTLAPDSAAQIPLLIRHPPGGRGTGFASKPCPDPMNGFAVQLANARLGEPEHFADLAKAALFLVVETEDQL